MAEYFIGIPSYKRPEGCKTLDYLEKIGFPRERIMLSVQTQEDEAAYIKSGVAARVGIFLFNKADSAAGNRNTILDHMPEGAKVVLMDDDIVNLDALDAAHKTGLRAVETTKEFEAIVERGFRLAEKNRTPCWGVYPVRNAYFMSDGYTGRNIVTTQVMGLIPGKKIRFADALKTKEDYELCCRIIRRYGACVRLNDVTINAPKSKGGCEEAWRDKEAAKNVADMLCAKYPDILRANPRREGEVLMVRGRKKSGRR